MPPPPNSCPLPPSPSHAIDFPRKQLYIHQTTATKMIALRAATSARVAVSRAPASMFVRYYAPDVRSEGATASSTSFHEREQAKEAQYVRQREAEKLKAAKAKLAEAQAEVEKQQKVVDSQN
ncbi:hypothetical protein C349_00797 [Cryptococcus neoformans var. grubii Br795]|nr:hypothetical protein C349_00797 [Cryptococcus neoformans var. grubii Br795]